MKVNATIGAQIGQRVRELIAAQHLSYSEVSRRAGVSAQSIVMLCRGKTDRPSVNLLLQIANALNVGVTELLNGLAAKPLPPEQVLAELVEALSALQAELRDVERRL